MDNASSEDLVTAETQRLISQISDLERACYDPTVGPSWLFWKEAGISNEVEMLKRRVVHISQSGALMGTAVARVQIYLIAPLQRGTMNFL